MIQIVETMSKDKVKIEKGHIGNEGHHHEEC